MTTSCIFPIPGNEEEEDPLDRQHRDVDHFNETQVQLEEARSEFLDGDVGQVHAAGTKLYWLDTSHWNPTIHSWDSESETTVDYTFSIGEGPYTYFRASSEAIAYVGGEGRGRGWHDHLPRL